RVARVSCQGAARLPSMNPDDFLQTLDEILAAPDDARLLRIKHGSQELPSSPGRETLLNMIHRLTGRRRSLGADILREQAPSDQA
ncbi:MAG: hypothetical protein ACT4P7_16175, partial [Gemmatimonadaceae bacterium]